MRSVLAVLFAFVLGVVLAVSLNARAQVTPPSYEYRTVYLGESYTPDQVTRVGNALGAERFRLATAIQVTPYGSALLVFVRENP
jgi:hypothetical protein